MNKQTIAILLLLITLGSCTQQQTKSGFVGETFKIPIVILEQTKDIIELFEVDSEYSGVNWATHSGAN